MEKIEEIREGMARAKKDLVSSVVVTKICIGKLEENIKQTDDLLSKFKL
jgi:hypothetical protein